MKRYLPLTALLLAGAAAPAFATTAVNSITRTGNDLSTATLAGGRVISGAEIVAATTVTPENTLLDYDIFWQSSDPKPSDTTLDSVLLALDITTGVLNPDTSGTGFFDLQFGLSITDGLMVFEPNGTSSESWTLQGLDSGGSVIGSPVNFASAAFGPMLFSTTFSRDSGANFTQEVYGVFVGVSEFNVAALTGVRVTTASGDPTLVVTVVPEPASAGLLALGAAALLVRRRR